MAILDALVAARVGHGRLAAMRTSKIAALAGILSGLLWIAAGALSWDETGLNDDSTMAWWAGLGFFVLASALVGYSAVTRSPLWLRVVVFVGAGALGGSILSSLDIEMDNAYLVVGTLGVVLLLVGLVGLMVRSGQGGSHTEPPPRGGRRAAR
jgi:peptidoglycan/LPS O-acetylase OafA/YrhL